MKGSVNNAEPFTLKHVIKGITELAIIVMDQKVEGFFSVLELPHQLSGLLGNPGYIWIGCDAGKMHPARTQFDEEKHIKGLQSDGFDGEEAASQDLILVMVDQSTSTHGTAANQGWLDVVTVEYIPYCCL